MKAAGRHVDTLELPSNITDFHPCPCIDVCGQRVSSALRENTLLPYFPRRAGSLLDPLPYPRHSFQCGWTVTPIRVSVPLRSASGRSTNLPIKLLRPHE